MSRSYTPVQKVAVFTVKVMVTTRYKTKRRSSSSGITGSTFSRCEIQLAKKN